MGCRTFRNFDLKVHRQLLGRIASRFIASLVFQLTVKGVFSRDYTGQRTYNNPENKHSTVNAEFLRGSKRKTHLLAGRVYHSADHNIGGRSQLENGGNQE